MAKERASNSRRLFQFSLHIAGAGWSHGGRGGFRIFLDLRGRTTLDHSQFPGGARQGGTYPGEVFRSGRHNAENVLARKVAETALRPT